MKLIFARIVGILGMLFALHNFDWMTRYAIESVKEISALDPTTTQPEAISKVIGEFIIILSNMGAIAIIPAFLIYVTLVPLKLRHKWFFTCAKVFSIYLLFLFPAGTIFGCILLWNLKRRQTAFQTQPTSDANPDVPKDS